MGGRASTSQSFNIPGLPWRSCDGTPSAGLRLMYQRRATMRNLILAGVMVAMATPFVSFAEAAPRNRPRQPVSVDSTRAATTAAAERDRANNTDPTGLFKGYPDWARTAFSSSRRSSR